MNRSRNPQAPWPVLLALHDAALLLAIFLAPIYGGAFNTNVATVALGDQNAGLSGLTFIAFCVTVAALAALAWRVLTRSRPGLLPNAIHLPALLLVAISAAATLTSLNMYASVLELTRLAIGVLFFALLANRALLPAAPREWTLAFFILGLPIVFFTSLVAEEPISSHLPATFSLLDVLVWVGAAGAVAMWLSPRHHGSPVRRLLEALVISAGVLAIWVIREKVIAIRVLDNPTWRCMGTFANPNVLGGFLALTFPPAVALALTSPWRAAKIAFSFIGLLLLAGLVCTVSKGSVLGLLVAALVCAVLLARSSPNPTRAGRAVGVGLLIIVLMAVGALLASHRVRDKAVAALGTGNASNMFRILTWTGTWRMASHYPWLGVGPGAWESVFGKYTPAGITKAAHEAYLQTAAEQGFAGLAILLWLSGAVLWTGWRVVRNKERAAANRLLAIGAIGGVVVLLVHSLLDNDWYIGATNLGFWLLVGALAHAAHGREVEAMAPAAETGKSKRRRAMEVATPKPKLDRDVHLLPWPAAGGGSAVAALACAAALISLLSFTVHSDSAQQAQVDGEKALRDFNQLAGATVQTRDASTLQELGSYYRLSVDSYRNATREAPLWAGGHETYACDPRVGRPRRGRGRARVPEGR